MVSSLVNDLVTITGCFYIIVTTFSTYSVLDALYARLIVFMTKIIKKIIDDLHGLHGHYTGEICCLSIPNLLVQSRCGEELHAGNSLSHKRIVYN